MLLTSTDTTKQATPPENSEQGVVLRYFVVRVFVCKVSEI